MTERAKITALHLSRQAIVYLRQSSAAQVEHNLGGADYTSPLQRERHRSNSAFLLHHPQALA